MRTFAIICEYNPLHKGHKFHIDSIKSTNKDVRIVAIMSGDFVQRGECAMFDKHLRARSALDAGCDLVLELPFPYCYLSAEYFARAGVYIADRIGICDTLSFGSESGDVFKLKDCANNLSDSKFGEGLKIFTESNPEVGFMSARHKVYTKLYGNADIMCISNNILALEYLKAMDSLKTSLVPHTIKREGDDYNNTAGTGTYVSASFIRSRIVKGQDIAKYIPTECVNMYTQAVKRGEFAQLKNLESAILAFFRLTPPEKLSKFAEISNGLEYRLSSAAKSAASIEDFFALAATKKYTDAKIRRAVISCLLSVKNSDIKRLPKYTNVLAANKTGQKMLKEMKKTSKIKIVTKTADYDKDNAYEAELASKAYGLSSLAFETPKSAEEYFKKTPYIEK